MNDGYFSLLYKEESEVIDYAVNNLIDFVIYRGRNALISKELEDLQIKVFNNSQTNRVANNKYVSFLFFKENNLPCVETFQKSEEVDEYPLVMKTTSGHGGQEVFLLNSPEDEARIEKEMFKDYIYQRYIPNVSDVRLYVLGGQVIGAVKREGYGDFRSNFSLGGKASTYQPSMEMKEVAIQIADLLDADYIGVDFFLTKDGLLLNEIEDPVGARMLYATSGVDAISIFIEHIKNQLK